MACCATHTCVANPHKLVVTSWQNTSPKSHGWGWTPPHGTLNCGSSGKTPTCYHAGTAHQAATELGVLAILTAPEQTTAARGKMINPGLFLPADAGRRTANIRVSVLSGGN
jgi:hypothetical protein